MLIYNTSFHVDGEDHLSEFLQYMRDEYLPTALSGGYLRNPRFVRLLTNIGDGLLGYSLMMETDGVATLKSYKKEIEPDLDQKFVAKFGDRILRFSTTMTEITL